MQIPFFKKGVAPQPVKDSAEEVVKTSGIKQKLVFSIDCALFMPGT